MLDTTGKGFTESKNGADYYRFKGYIHSIPQTEYETELTARAFAFYDGEYFYSEKITRSIRYVAESAYYSDDYEDEKDMISEYIHKDFVGKASAAEGVKTTYIDHASYTYAELKNSVMEGTAISGRLKNKNYIVTEKDYSCDNNYISVEFKGENFPGAIIFGASEISGDLNSVYGYGINLDSSSVGGTFERSPQPWDQSSVERWKESNPDYMNYNYFRAGGKDKSFILVAGITKFGVNPMLQWFLYEKTESGIALLDKWESGNSAIGTTVLSGKILIAGSSLAVSNAGTKVKVSAPDTYANVMNKIYSEIYGIETASASGKATVSVADKGLSVDIPQINNGGFGYLVGTKDYASGTFIRIEFQGLYAPGRILFGVTDKGITWDEADGIGFNLDSNWNTQTYNNKASADVVGNLNRGYLRNKDKFTPEENPNLNSSFVLVAGATQSGADVTLQYSLYKKSDDGSSLTLVEAKTYTVADATLNAGKIMITNSKVVANNTTVTWFVPDTLEKINASLKSDYGYEA